MILKAKAELDSANNLEYILKKPYKVTFCFLNIAREFWIQYNSHQNCKYHKYHNR